MPRRNNLNFFENEKGPGFPGLFRLLSRVRHSREDFMGFLGDILIGVFLAAATTALVSKRLRPRAQVVAGVSLLLFVVLIMRGR